MDPVKAHKAATEFLLEVSGEKDDSLIGQDNPFIESSGAEENKLLEEFQAKEKRRKEKQDLKEKEKELEDKYKKKEEEMSEKIEDLEKKYKKLSKIIQSKGKEEQEQSELENPFTEEKKSEVTLPKTEDDEELLPPIDEFEADETVEVPIPEPEESNLPSVSDITEKAGEFFESIGDTFKKVKDFVSDHKIDLALPDRSLDKIYDYYSNLQSSAAKGAVDIFKEQLESALKGNLGLSSAKKAVDKVKKYLYENFNPRNKLALERIFDELMKKYN